MQSESLVWEMTLQLLPRSDLDIPVSDLDISKQRPAKREAAKPRVAVLCPGYGWIARGVERFVEEIVSRLNEEFDLSIYSLGPRKILTAKINFDSNVVHYHVPAARRTSRLAAFYSKIASRLGWRLSSASDCECMSFAIMAAPRLLFGRYDVVLNFAGYYGELISNLHRRIRKSLVIYSGQAGIGWVDEMMAGLAPDMFVALSPPAEKWTRQNFPSLPVTMIPNGVNASCFGPYVQPALLDVPKPVVLFVGAMEPMKRPHLTIQAMTRLNGVSLLMIGDGSLSNEIKLLGSRMLGAERFQYIPYVPNEKLPRYYGACDLFTLPSYEPFGIVFLEAMACNKAVVAQQGHVQEWIIADAGITCSCKDIDEYAAVLRKALETDFGNQPRERAQQFDWEDIAQMYGQLIDQLLSADYRKDRALVENLHDNEIISNNPSL